MIFWIATALLSNIIDREKLAGKNNIYFILLLILFVSLLYITESKLNLELFVIFHLLTIFIASIIQIKTLSRKKIYFKKTAVILVFLNVITFIIYYLSFNN
jgi:hypothetical protein